jgi:sugar O-acyltransferase (sialic acid O-acetyltransferase NeuD family)
VKPAILVIGSGGHAVVVADALLAAGERVLGFTDVDASRHGLALCGLPVLGDDRVLAAHSPDAVLLAIGIGGVRGEPARRGVHERLQAAGWRVCGVRHPSAIVSPFARLGAGVQLMAGSIVQPGAEIGDGAIVNTAAVVEHDCVVGRYVHVAPRALLCGNVVVGDDGHVGAGAVVRQGIRLGARTVVGAGAVVVKDYNGAGLLVGMPARPRE